MNESKKPINSTSLSEVLKSLVEESKLTHAEMATRIGIPQNDVTMIINGDLVPEGKIIERFCNALDITFKDFSKKWSDHYKEKWKSGADHHTLEILAIVDQLLQCPENNNDD